MQELSAFCVLVELKCMEELLKETLIIRKCKENLKKMLTEEIFDDIIDKHSRDG